TLNSQLLGADPAQRRERSVQYVIEPAEGVCGLDRQDIMRLFHHADLIVLAMRVAAVEAQVAFTNVVALRANAELVFDVEKRLGEVLNIVAGSSQQMKGDTLSGFLADARQPFTLLNKPRERLREFRHLSAGLEEARREPEAA